MTTTIQYKKVMPEEPKGSEQISSVKGSSLSYLRGHKIEFINGECVYSDNNQSTVRTHKNRPCGKCGKHGTIDESHDACLGVLPGIINACCGHGEPKKAYIQFFDGVTIHGRDAIKLQEIMKKYNI